MFFTKFYDAFTLWKARKIGFAESIKQNQQEKVHNSGGNNCQTSNNRRVGRKRNKVCRNPAKYRRSERFYKSIFNFGQNSDCFPEGDEIQTEDNKVAGKRS